MFSKDSDVHLPIFFRWNSDSDHQGFSKEGMFLIPIWIIDRPYDSNIGIIPAQTAFTLGGHILH